MTRLIVTDANIFIDLQVAGLLDEMFALPEIEFVVPDTLYIEELADQHGRLPGLGLKVVSLEAEAIDEAVRLRQRYPKPSLHDLLALALARSLSCSLMTGDRHLREAAELEEVVVHGTLWLMESLLEARIVSIARVETAYESMRTEGRRLPWGDVSRQLRRWRT